MAKIPAGFKLAAKVAQKELPKLQEQRSKLLKELQDLDETIMLTQNIIGLWHKKSGKPSPVAASLDTKAGQNVQGENGEKTAFHRIIADILKNGRSLSVKEIVPIVSQRVGRPVSPATVYSAILRKSDVFERKGKGYRLRIRKETIAPNATLA